MSSTPARPRLLDLFCGAGGASVGYWRAGFDVIGIDVAPQPNYPFTLIEDDVCQLFADEVGFAGFDAIHASPPCQRWIRSGMLDHGLHPDLLTPLRPVLEMSGLPYVIENVPGAPLRADVSLCGSMFGLAVRRHRWFECSWGMRVEMRCDHGQPSVGVYGHPRGRQSRWGAGTFDDWQAAMGIDWMQPYELSEAIPPAYTELVGKGLLGALCLAA